LRDNGFFVVLIVALVAVIGMIVVSVDPVSDLPVSPDADFVGLAIDGFSDPLSGFTFNNNVVSVSDSAVYRFGYYSVDGAPWQQFSLNGNVFGGNWLTGTATKTLPDFGPGEHYVVIYSCTRVSGAWNCHGNRWQLHTFSNSVSSTPYLTVDYLKNFSSAGDNDYFIIKSNIAWTISSSPSWVTLSKTSGVGNDSVTVTAAANTGAQRTGTITLTGQGVPSVSLNWIQYAGTVTNTCSGTQPSTSCTTAEGTGTRTVTCVSGNWVTGTCVVASKGTGKIYYLAPAPIGSDVNGDGSINKPWFTLNKAWTVIVPGDTIYLRGGTYVYTSKQQLTGKNGAAENLIKVWAYNDETPNLTINNPLTLTGWPYSLIYFDGDYFHWKGIEISGIAQNPDSSGGGALRVESSSHNIFELFNIHDNGFGWHINGQSTDNLILNCDIYNIYDPYSTSTDSTTGLQVADPYEDGDGFSIGYGNAGTFNTFRGCRAWNVTDDGWDLWKNDGEILLENCWAWSCGYAEDGISEGGNGQGFKFGISDTSGTNVLVTARNTISAYNRQSGYHQNGMLHPVALYNNIAYANGAQGFWFGAWSTSEYSSGIKHILTNNVEYKNRYKPYLTAGSVLTTNTFLVNGNNNSNYVVTDADFVSLDESQLLRPRKADGSLPDITFLHLRSDSDLINKGVAVPGRTVDGDGNIITGAPDLGVFEYR